MNKAEARDLNLFVASELMLGARRMPATELFQLPLVEVLDPSNDNRALATWPGYQKSGSE